MDNEQWTMDNEHAFFSIILIGWIVNKPFFILQLEFSWIALSLSLQGGNLWGKQNLKQPRFAIGIISQNFL